MTDWQTTDLLKTPMEVCWQFDYEIHMDKLQNLYTKSKKMMWDSDVDIDWSREIDPSKPLVGQRLEFAEIGVFAKLSEAQKELCESSGAQRTRALGSNSKPVKELCSSLVPTSRLQPALRRISSWRKALKRLSERVWGSVASAGVPSNLPLT